MKLKEMILSKLEESQLARIVEEHMAMSIALGVGVGINANTEDGEIQKKAAIIDEKINEENGAELVKSNNKEIIFSFLRV